MPARPRLATKAATETTFQTWDELVAEATVDLPSYQLPLGPDDVVEIPCPSGDHYLEIVAGQRTNDANRMFENLVPDGKVRARIRLKMRNADYPVIDLLCGKVLRYYFGLSIATEEKSGNSAAS